MKRKKVYLALIVGIFISSCKPGVSNPSTNLIGKDPDFIVQVDSIKYKIKRIDLGNAGGSFYIMVPANSEVKLYQDLPQSIGYGKSQTIIKIR